MSPRGTQAKKGEAQGPSNQRRLLTYARRLVLCLGVNAVLNRKVEELGDEALQGKGSIAGAGGDASQGTRQLGGRRDSEADKREQDIWNLKKWLS